MVSDAGFIPKDGEHYENGSFSVTQLANMPDRTRTSNSEPGKRTKYGAGTLLRRPIGAPGLILGTTKCSAIQRTARPKSIPRTAMTKSIQECPRFISQTKQRTRFPRSQKCNDG